MFKKHPFLLFLPLWLLLFLGQRGASPGLKGNTIPSVQDQQFLARIKKDISFSKDVVLSVGPYEGLKDINLNNGVVISVDFESPAYIAIRDSTYYILIDYDFYIKITEEERKYVIAHEMGHAHHGLFKGIEAQKTADVFALRFRYVKPEVIVGFLNRYCSLEEECQERIKNILNFKQE